jgi:hypothetical protein
MNKIELDRILNEFLKDVYSCIPEKCFSGAGYANFEFHTHLSKYNNDFKGSDYYYNGINKFVHWTSVKNLMSIINNKEIRLYNLHNSSDSTEFNYAATNLPIEKDQIDNLKKLLYTFSFCDSSEINNPLMWENYGNNYGGVALEFEITNDIENWQDFMLSKMYYKIPYQLIELKNKLEYLKKENSEMKPNFNFGKLIGFHKDPKFKTENEIRISILNLYEDIEEYYKNCKLDFNFDKKVFTEYFKLKLWSKDIDPQYFTNKPQIKITKITFGENCGFDIQNFQRNITTLYGYFDREFGYEVEINPNFAKKDV